MALRYRPHQSHKTADLIRTAGDLFEKYIGKLVSAMFKAATAQNAPMPPIPQELADQLAERAGRHARGVRLRRIRRSKREARRRHRTARRINFGLVSGNRSRRTHSGRR
jgi:hypothetical protein